MSAALWRLMFCEFIYRFMIGNLLVYRNQIIKLISNSTRTCQIIICSKEKSIVGKIDRTEEPSTNRSFPKSMWSVSFIRCSFISFLWENISTKFDDKIVVTYVIQGPQAATTNYNLAKIEFMLLLIHP